MIRAPIRPANRMIRRLAVPAVIAAGLAAGAPFAATPAHAAGGGVAPKEVAWTFNGVFGRYNYEQLRRGLQVYREVCAACHGLRLVAYRDLAAIGLSEAQIRAIAGEKEVAGEPDEEGEPTTRPAEAKDRFVDPFPNVQAAMASNNGAAPPDLSLMVKARGGGADYVFSLMTGYVSEAACKKEFKDSQGKPLVPGEGQYCNTYMPGHIIAMAPPLTEDGQVEYEEKGAPAASIDQMAKDVTAFLAWAAEPYMVERKRMGIKVMLFLLLFTGFMYAIYRQVKKDVKGQA